MTTCKLNQIFLGEVSSVQNYGAFVRIPGCRKQGLIHKSQVSSARVDDVCEVLQRGERVWCKVVNIDDDGKIGLSMKFVNQGNGIDLDPNGVEWHRNEQKMKNKTFNEKRERKAIELEAVLNTTCTQCGTKGHLASHCFVTPDGKKYELLSENEDNDISTKNLIDKTKTNKLLKNTNNKYEKKSKSKKLKKHKKSKKSKSTENNSDNDDDDDDDDDDDGDGDGDGDSLLVNDQDNKNNKKKKKKKHSKEIKKRKRKYSSSSSDSNDDNDDNNDNLVKEKHSKKCKHSRSKYSD